ncbi:F-box/kelch-repeat protein At1g57790-like [Quercus lobata]|uniref:F-box/kelch-repeat protein At1g57790-like n=1 Tax=Quercus lobata TaxID=97700 RepID=UPI0012460640|nr:F-box/kelch-repeat protein At1g57790-like [Quercus lobata]
MHIPELQGASIRFSKYGWLLLSRKDCSIFFFHPFNRIKIELPRYPQEDAFQTMCFSSPPDSIDCFVFGITFNGAKFGIIRRGEVYWTIREFIRGFEPYGISSCSPLLYKGKCYWLGHAGRVGVFDLQKYMRAQDTNNEYLCRWAYHSSILLEMLGDSLHRSYLLESDGKLLAVFELHDNEPSFFIFSLNLSSIRPKMKWHPKRNMGNKLLYVSSGGSFSELAVIKGMRNMIYMPTVQGNSNVFYSFRTKKYHYFCKDHSCRTSSHGEEPINCTWINPMRIDLDEAFEW